MGFISTGGEGGSATLREALLRGLAPDGSLYMPRTLPSLSVDDIRDVRRGDWPTGVLPVAHRLFSGSLEKGALEEVFRGALNFPVPLVRLGDRIFVLELFRGPTLAFKDVGARSMARLLGLYRDPDGPPLTVLTATSGDTGGAVAQAFLGLPGIRVVVLFPDGKVTPRQERQFSTLGGNVLAVAVQGDFDDCQRLAKGAFGDRELRARIGLTSANSINVGRFLPQALYFFHAWARIQENAPGSEILFSVPSGNFGNLAAGLLAKAMGLPHSSFLAATNANQVVPELLRTGRYHPRPSIRTLSTAMDVGDPSNLARILHLYGHDLDRLRRDLKARSVSDEETRTSIRETYARTGYLLDPHSAVGLKALEATLKDRPGEVGVLLATAHPAKFAEVVEPIVDEAIPLPPELARCMEGNRLVTPMKPRPEALRELLVAES
jgi:threonine synthase